jgi:hypothetical protein
MHEVTVQVQADLEDDPTEWPLKSLILGRGFPAEVLRRPNPFVRIFRRDKKSYRISYVADLVRRRLLNDALSFPN